MTALPPATKMELETPKQRTRQIEGEIDEIRRRLDRNLSELDRRRHEATDWRLQMRRHPRLVAGVGIGALALLGGMVAMSVAKSRREHPKRRAQRIGLALRRGYQNPEKVARPEPSVAVKVLAAVATTVGTSLAKKYIEQAWNTKKAQPPAPIRY
ncbi:MAG: hypothetical protein NVSMB23_25530 [Myxococcales bacterium]